MTTPDRAAERAACEPEDAQGESATLFTSDPATNAESRSTKSVLRRFAGRRYTVPVIIAFLIGVICEINHFHGVDWGDDFALYMHQAKALTVGNIGQVISDNRYTVDNSGWHTFSPYVYPWGWPVLVAPVYLLFGLNYEIIKFVEVVALGGFLVFFYDLVRRRAGSVPAILLVSLIGLSQSYVVATDSVDSDLPYLCFVGLSLWWLDRCGLDGILECGRRRLVALGLLIAFAFNIRREGVLLLTAVAALQVSVLARMALRARSGRVLRHVQWKDVLLPYGTFAAAAVGFQLLLPSQLVPVTAGGGLKVVHANYLYFRDVLAQTVNLEAPGGQPIQLFHSHLAGVEALRALLFLAVIGLATRLVHRFEEDVPLAAYLCCMTLVALTAPQPDGRYLDTVTPFLFYFAFQALPSLFALVWKEPQRLLARAPAIVASVAFAALVILNVQAVQHSTDYHLRYSYTIDGPETPAAQQMFAAVDQYTRGDDIILFSRARAMTLYTNRIALQGSNPGQMFPQVNWYVMAKGSTYSQLLLTDSQAAHYGLTEVWQNSAWVLWRVPPDTQ